MTSLPLLLRGLALVLALALPVGGMVHAPEMVHAQEEDLPPAIIHNERGLELTTDGRHAEAVEAFRKALAEAPENGTIRRNLALARSNLAVQLLDDGDLENATHNAEEALKLQPDDPIVVLNVGACYEEQGYPDKAAELVRKAHEMAPELAVARARMARLHYREGRLDEAIAEWEKAAELDPADNAVRERLARAKKNAELESTMTTRLSAHFEVLHDAEGSVLASLVLRELEDAYKVVGADVQNYTDRAVKVVLLSEEEFREATGAHGWVAGLYDGQIRLPVKGAGDRKGALLQRARHEYVHAALAPLGRRAPSWLHEGLAQAHEGRKPADARKRLARSGAPKWDDLGVSFASTASSSRARVLYDAALAFVDWLRAGERGTAWEIAMQRLFDGERLGDAFELPYDETLEELYAAFTAELSS